MATSITTMSKQAPYYILILIFLPFIASQSTPTTTTPQATTQPTPTQSPHTTQKTDSQLGPIIGGAVASVAILAICIMAIFIYRHRGDSFPKFRTNNNDDEIGGGVDFPHDVRPVYAGGERVGGLEMGEYVQTRSESQSPYVGVKPGHF